MTWLGAGARLYYLLGFSAIALPTEVSSLYLTPTFATLASHEERIESWYPSA